MSQIPARRRRRLQTTAAAGLLLGLAMGCGEAPRPADPGSPPAAAGTPDPRSTASAGFAGSASCRQCHESFYELWAPSHHGRAMQPFTPDLARADLEPQDDAIAIGEVTYRAVLNDSGGHVLERGPAGEKPWR